jgi:hypothetical protein
LPPPEDRGFADVWSALGGELKPSIDVVVSAPINTGQQFEVGPPVITPPRFHFGGSSDVPVSENVGLSAVDNELEESKPSQPAAKSQRTGKSGRTGRSKRQAASDRAKEPEQPATRPEPFDKLSTAPFEGPATSSGRSGGEERAGVPAQTIRGAGVADPARVSIRRQRKITRPS